MATMAVTQYFLALLQLVEAVEARTKPMVWPVVLEAGAVVLAAF